MPMMVMYRPINPKAVPMPSATKAYRVQRLGSKRSITDMATVAMSSSIKNQPPELKWETPSTEVGATEGLKKNPKSAKNAAPPAMNSPQVLRELRSIFDAPRGCCMYG